MTSVKVIDSFLYPMHFNQILLFIFTWEKNPRNHGFNQKRNEKTLKFKPITFMSGVVINLKTRENFSKIDFNFKPEMFTWVWKVIFNHSLSMNCRKAKSYSTLRSLITCNHTHFVFFNLKCMKRAHSNENFTWLT